MLILGISALYHDSAAAICKDGVILAAVQEERFTRKKHDLSLPINAIRYCLSVAQIDITAIDQIVYYDNPILTLDRMMRNIIALGDNAYKFASDNLPNFLRNKLWIEEIGRAHV